MKNFLLYVFLVIPFLTHSQLIIENKGQIKNTDVKYYSSFGDWVFYFLDDRVAVVKSETEKKEDRNTDIRKLFRFDLIPQFTDSKMTACQEGRYYHNFINKNNVFKVKTFRSLKYTAKEFDIIFYTDDNIGLKYDFIYHNKFKKGKQEIHFLTEGSKDITYINGSVSVKTDLGSLSIQVPLAYSDQTTVSGDISRKTLPVQQKIKGKEIIYEFYTEEKDAEIIIDPWATFAGGSDVDEAYGSAFDSNGNIYISGYCSSLDLPVTTGVIQTMFNGLYDAFVFKFDPNGSRIWSTYYGGTNNDFGYKITVNSNDKPILSGYSYSNDLTVSSSGVFSSSFTGVFDAFVLLMKDDGTFDKATYYGGTGGEFVTDMDILNDEIIIGGFTSSSDLPVYSGAWQPTMAGALDIFVVKFDSSFNRIWDTYYGGTNSEDAHTVSFDPFGNVLIGGDTYSSDFPVTVNAFQNSYTNGNDMCLLKFDSGGNLLWSTYFGSMANEDCEAIDCDEFGNIYFTGYVTGSGLPITTGLFMDTYSGDRDIIFGEFSPGGNLQWTTYAGGNAWDSPRDILINDGGILMISGETYSLDFPEVGDTLQSGNNGNSDVVYIVADSTGIVSLSTLWGGSGAETGNSISFDGLFKTAIAGTTSSADLDVNSDIFQPSLAGQTDAFLKITDSTAGVFLSNPTLLFPENSFLLYPNPVNNELILSAIKNDHYLIRIMDISGKLVYHKKEFISSQYRITDIPEISSGQYVIILQGKENYYQQKFIKF